MIRGVVFDLDGTLVDSWAVHLSCLRQAAQECGAGRPSAARTVAAQRATDVETLRGLVGDERLAAAREAYSRALRAMLPQQPALLMAGARAAVDGLRERGLTVGVCTGRSRADAQALLDASGLDLALTVANEDAARPKPAPDGLLTALRTLGLDPAEALYVGDTPADQDQGRSAGVRTVLVGPAAGDRPADLTGLVDLVVTGRRNSDG
jgi:HAD superfamily hydrolase (TIGR01509 family)